GAFYNHLVQVEEFLLRDSVQHKVAIDVALKELGGVVLFSMMVGEYDAFNFALDQFKKIIRGKEIRFSILDFPECQATFFRMLLRPERPEQISCIEQLKKHHLAVLKQKRGSENSPYTLLQYAI